MNAGGPGEDAAGTSNSITELACVPMPRTSLPSTRSAPPPAFRPLRTSPHSVVARRQSRSASAVLFPSGPSKAGSIQSAQSQP